MNAHRRKKLQEAATVLGNGDFMAAEAILVPMWEEIPSDFEVFRLLNDCYMAQEKWKESEHLIRAIGQTLTGEDIEQDALLTLFLNKNDLTSALKIAHKMLSDTPGFFDLEEDVFRKFSEAGAQDAFLKSIGEKMPDGKEKNLLLARFYVATAGNYHLALQYVDLVLQNDASDEDALSFHKIYRRKERDNLIQEATIYMSDWNPKEAIPLYKKVLELEPTSVTAQEYYLCAIAAQKIAPFRWYFYKTNFIGILPWALKAIAYLVFMLVCVIYYKDGKPVGSPDHLKGPIALFATIVIPRYTLLPLAVQLLSFRWLPGYHLLKKPYDFICGAILLASWSYYAYSIFLPGIKGFDLFMAATFMLHTLNFHLIKVEKKASQRWLLIVYAFTALTLAILSGLNLIPDIYKFFIFASWLPIALYSALYDKYREYREAKAR